MSTFLQLPEFRAMTPMPSEDVDRLVHVRWTRQPADSAANVATLETRVGRVGESGNVAEALVTPTAPLVADDANYATVNLYKRTGGGARVLLGALTTRTVGVGGSGPWAADVPLALTLSGGAPVTANDMLTAEITKTGTGVVVPPFALAVRPSVSVIDRMLTTQTSWILSRLRKRYSTEKITATTPDVVKGWLCTLVTLDCYKRRGWQTGLEINQEFIDAAEAAKTEIKEAADAVEGLFDLPLLADPSDGTGIAKGGPLSYSEASPYAWMDVQAGLVLP